MDLLMVSAEIAPYVRQTEAADAVASLAKALRHLGHNVSVLCPRQPGFEEAGLMMARRLTPLPLADGGEVTLTDAQLPSGVQLTTFDAPVLFDRPGVYGENGKDYPDNAKRFGLIAQVTRALVQQRLQQGQALDILHAHDVAAGLALVLLKESDEVGITRILTVHDGNRQGVFPLKEFDDLGMPGRLASEEGFRLGGKLNALKAAMLAADAVITVSPTHARALGEEAQVGALAEVVQGLEKPIVSVPYGVDYATFNPATDAALATRFAAEDVDNKGRCKTHLIREVGLELELERPLFVFAGPLDKERGFDLVLAALPKLLKQELSLLVVGEGTPALVKRLEALVARHGDRLAHLAKSDSVTLRRAAAAADFALLADPHVPCGAMQFIAQRYGAVVVARAAGGILDTVVDVDSALETGSGFLFDAADPTELLGAVERAMAAHRSPRFAGLRRRVMRQDMSWDRPARRTLQIYRQTMGSTA